MGFYLYKGLKKPLVFFGLKGKYIIYAVGVISAGVVASLILSKFGLLGSLIGIAATAGGVYLIFTKQDKYGLYSKTKNFDEILIFPKKFSYGGGFIKIINQETLEINSQTNQNENQKERI